MGRFGERQIRIRKTRQHSTPREHAFQRWIDRMHLNEKSYCDEMITVAAIAGIPITIALILHAAGMF